MVVRRSIFMGSLNADLATNTEAAMRFFLQPLPGGGSLDVPGIPSGEIGEPWLLREVRGIIADRAVVGREGAFAKTGRYMHGPKGIVIPGRRLSMLSMGVTSRAARAYDTLGRICAEHKTRTPPLQVGMRILEAGVLTLPLQIWQQRHRKLFVHAMVSELEAMWHRMDGNVFCLFELPLSTIMANLLRNSTWVDDWFCDVLAEVIARVQVPLNYGLHFCYGDLDNAAFLDHGRLATRLRMHKLVYDPLRTARWVETLINRLWMMQQGGRSMKLWGVHIPLALASRPPSLDPATYQRAFGGIILPEAIEVITGCLHFGRETEEIMELLPVLDDIFGRTVGVAPACGWGRKPVPYVLREFQQLRDIVASH